MLVNFMRSSCHLSTCASEGYARPVEAHTRRRGRPRADEAPASSDEILLAALRSFADRGYDGTSVRELNHALGVSHNLINRRFGSKERLWRAAVDRWFGELVDALAPSATVDGAGDPLERLREFIVTFIEVNARRPEMARLMNVEASVGGPRLDYLFERFVTPCLVPAVALSAKLQAEGRMRPVPLGTMFFLITHGATAPAAHGPLAALLGITDPTDPTSVRVHARTVAELLIQPAT
jgi:TetR/AcrR family transcriptional regulator